MHGSAGLVLAERMVVQRVLVLRSEWASSWLSPLARGTCLAKASLPDSANPFSTDLLLGVTKRPHGGQKSKPPGPRIPGPPMPIISISLASMSPVQTAEMALAIKAHLSVLLV